MQCVHHRNLILFNIRYVCIYVCVYVCMHYVCVCIYVYECVYVCIPAPAP
jgi:hypothetical protein